MSAVVIQQPMLPQQIVLLVNAVHASMANGINVWHADVQQEGSLQGALGGSADSSTCEGCVKSMTLSL